MSSSKWMRYRNIAYRFSMIFPRRWRSYVTIVKRPFSLETEYELHFRFKYKGNVYEDIFAIMVYRMSRKAWIKRGYGDSPLVFIAEHDGRVFAYITPEELPYAFIDPKTGDYNYTKYGHAIRLLKRMVNDDVPRIVRTFRFFDARQ